MFVVVVEPIVTVKNKVKGKKKKKKKKKIQRTKNNCPEIWLKMLL